MYQIAVLVIRRIIDIKKNCHMHFLDNLEILLSKWFTLFSNKINVPIEFGNQKSLTD